MSVEWTPTGTDALWLPFELEDTPTTFTVRDLHAAVECDASYENFHMLAAAYGVMAACPQHTFVVIGTPEQRRRFETWAEQQDADACLTHATAGRLMCVYSALAYDADDPAVFPQLHSQRCGDPEGPWPLPNVTYVEELP